MQRSIVAGLLVLLLAVAGGVDGADRAAAEGTFEPVVTGLDFAVNLAFAPGGRGFVAEKATGQIVVMRDGRILDVPFATLPVDASTQETGLLGIAVASDFATRPWVYAYYADATDGRNHLVRIRAEGDRGTHVETLFAEIATTSIHNGGDLAFAKDGTLFLVTGDGAEEARAQDPADPHGKVLRFEPDGSIPPDNPIPGSPVYALGIRNGFGLCVDAATGELWETENGPESWDEVNRIEAGANYGWPTQLGPGAQDGLVEPVFAFEQVVVPTGCDADGSDSGLTFGDFHGDLHRLSFPGPGANDPSPQHDVIATFEQGITDVERDARGRLWVLTPSTIFRSLTEGAASPGSPGDVIGPGTPSASSSPTASPAGDDGLGGALGSTGVIVVIAILAGAFLWLRSRTLRR